MLKMQRCHAQNAEKSCSKCRNVMLKMQKRHTEMSCAKCRLKSCSKCRDVMLKMQKRHTEMSCAKCRLKSCSKRRLKSCSKCETQNNAHYVFTVQYVFYLIPTLAEVSMSELREGTRDLDSFWPTVMSICAQLERHYNTDDLSLAEQLILRAEECTSVLRAIHGRVCEVVPGSAILHDVLFVIGELQNYCQHYTEWTLRDERDHPRLPIQPDCPVQHSVCSPGRPSYVVQRADLEALLEAGFNFRQMATIHNRPIELAPNSCTS